MEYLGLIFFCQLACTITAYNLSYNVADAMNEVTVDMLQLYNFICFRFACMQVIINYIYYFLLMYLFLSSFPANLIRLNDAGRNHLQSYELSSFTTSVLMIPSIFLLIFYYPKKKRPVEIDFFCSFVPFVLLNNQEVFSNKK